MSSYSFSQSSLKQLATCDERLQRLAYAVIEHVDCKIICGRRSKIDQDTAFWTGTSRKKWPESAHNCPDPNDPSREDPNGKSKAMDIGPYPIVWPDQIKDSKDRARALFRWYMFVGVVLGVASQLGIRVRTGADWDSDWDLNDQRFDDLPHVELVE